MPTCTAPRPRPSSSHRRRPAGPTAPRSRRKPISTTSEFYLAQAAESARAARETNLSNVRERCLRAEAAWQAMADRLIRNEQGRQSQAADKQRQQDANR
ncbi:hypothetical protein [Sphingomonas sanxanigenens]|uniref:hypothetical protein n=1 Tax=Sphingomonas sanxanigenens TaxID=397260 RepID=UPI0004B6EC67|nr:hypothetical protein [Sphingomonas sanxanigenens]